MSPVRSITATDAKARLGELLASLEGQGAVEITRNGRPVGMLVAPHVDNQLERASRLAALATLYAAGAISWRKIADETQASFGELLIELGVQGLKLPRVVAKKRPEQVAIFDQALAHAKSTY